MKIQVKASVQIPKAEDDQHRWQILKDLPVCSKNFHLYKEYELGIDLLQNMLILQWLLHSFVR